MKNTAADILIDTINDWGVEVVFGLPGPVLVEAVVDPFEPPMPPKVTLKQATKLAQSLMRLEPNRDKTIATVLRDKVRQIV